MKSLSKTKNQKPKTKISKHPSDNQFNRVKTIMIFIVFVLGSYAVKAQYNLYSFSNKAHCTVNIQLITCGSPTPITFHVDPNSDHSFTLDSNQFPEYIKADFGSNTVAFVELTSACDPPTSYSLTTWIDPCYYDALFTPTYTAYPPYDNQFSFAVY